MTTDQGSPFDTARFFFAEKPRHASIADVLCTNRTPFAAQRLYGVQSPGTPVWATCLGCPNWARMCKAHGVDRTLSKRAWGTYNRRSEPRHACFDDVPGPPTLDTPGMLGRASRLRPACRRAWEGTGSGSRITRATRASATGSTMTRETRTYTDDERSAALELYVANGLSYAHHETGVPRSTLRHWAKRAGHDPALIARCQLETIASALEAMAGYREEIREELRTKLLEAALEATDRAVTGGDVSKDLAPLSIAAGTFLDKYRLEMGEATGREERGAIGDARTKAAAILDELGAKRAAKEDVA